jgi:hypothetical protein
MSAKEEPMTFANAKKLVSRSLFVAVLAGTSLGLGSGCVARGHYSTGAVVASQPPPPRYEAADPRPGYVWVDGRWDWDPGYGEWVWYEGYYEPMRPGYVYVRGNWVNRGSQYVYERPRWQRRDNARATIHIDDHSRRSQVRVRENSGGHVPSRPVIRR